MIVCIAPVRRVCACLFTYVPVRAPAVARKKPTPPASTASFRETPLPASRSTQPSVPWPTLSSPLSKRPHGRPSYFLLLNLLIIHLWLRVSSSTTPNWVLVLFPSFFLNWLDVTLLLYRVYTSASHLRVPLHVLDTGICTPREPPSSWTPLRVRKHLLSPQTCLSPPSFLASPLYYRPLNLYPPPHSRVHNLQNASLMAMDPLPSQSNNSNTIPPPSPPPPPAS